MIDKDYYEPRGVTIKALERALEHVNSVSYAVSARWVFYRLLQEGYYQKKSDYANKFIKAVSRARHASWGGWRPDTLSDAGRQPTYRGHGRETRADWYDDFRQEVICELAKWHDQDYYVELWFEALAMLGQFMEYTEQITLRPMGGHPSIDYKYRSAKDLENAAAVYGKPIVILYFGDLDAGGECIEQVTHRDVQKWCRVDFTFIRCGLNAEHPALYNIPENPDKPGEYQWEALSDDGARELITSNLEQFVRQEVFRQTQQKERDAEDWVERQLEELVSELPEDWR